MSPLGDSLYPGDFTGARGIFSRYGGTGLAGVEPVMKNYIKE